MIKKILPWFAAFLTLAIWAETFISTKVLLNNGMAPSDIFFCRFTIAYLLIWIISPKILFAKDLKDELKFLALGTTGGSLYFLTENTALEYSTASNVAILVTSAPLLVALVVGIFYKEERMTSKQLAGSMISFIGMALVALNGNFVLHLNPLGDLLAFCAALSWAFYSLIFKNMSGKYDLRFLTRKVFAYGLLTMCIYFLTIKPFELQYDIIRRPVVWGNILYLGVVASMLCFVMWNWAMSKIGTVKVSNIIYSQSFITMILAATILGERISLMAISGAVILILGMMIALGKRTGER